MEELRNNPFFIFSILTENQIDQCCEGPYLVQLMRRRPVLVPESLYSDGNKSMNKQAARVLRGESRCNIPGSSSFYNSMNGKESTEVKCALSIPTEVFSFVFSVQVPTQIFPTVLNNASNNTQYSKSSNISIYWEELSICKQMPVCRGRRGRTATEFDTFTTPSLESTLGWNKPRKLSASFLKDEKQLSLYRGSHQDHNGSTSVFSNHYFGLNNSFLGKFYQESTQNITLGSRNAGLGIFSVLQGERKCLHKISSQKWFSINYWVQTGLYGLAAHPQRRVNNPYKDILSKNINRACRVQGVSSEEIQGYVKIATKVPSFQSSFVIEVQISGTAHFAILDSGASRCLLSNIKFEEIFGKNCAILKTPPLINFFGADGNTLKLLGEVETQLVIGKFAFLCNFLVFEAPHREILLAYDLFTKFQFLMTTSNLYVPNDIFGSQNRFIFRVGEKDNPYYKICLVQDLNCPAGAAQNIQVCISEGDVTTEQKGQLLKESFICHSEDVQGINDERLMEIYFQMVSFVLEDSKLVTNILFTNKSPEYIYHPAGFHVGHAEQMFAVSGDLINEFAPAVVKHIFRVVDFDQLPQKTLPSLADFFIDSDEKKVDFSQPNCCPGHPDLEVKIKELCLKYKSVFATNKFDIGECTESDQVSFSIRTGTEPVHCRPYPVNQKLHSRAMEFISKLLDMGLFQPADKNEAWASSCFFLLKSPLLNQIQEGGSLADNEDQEDKDAKLPVRMIINYSKFNSKVKKTYSVHPQNTCRDALNRLQCAKYASKLDINNCFYNLRIKKSIRGTLSFVYADMHLTPQRLMHGLVFASSVWCSVLAKLLRNAGIQNNVVYLIDDIFVLAQTKTEYLQVLGKLFAALIKANFKLKFEKALFNITHLTTFKAFGWQIRLASDLAPGTLQADPEKLEELKKLVKPKTPKDCRKFCGKFGFFAETFPNINKILAPLFKAGGMEKKLFRWTDELESAYKQALRSLFNSQILYIPDFNKPFYLVSDACRKSACHIALYQRHPVTQHLIPIKFASMSLQKTLSMSNWSQYKAEAFALFWGTQSNYTYLAMGQSFAFTDCASLSWLAHWKFASHQVFTWQLAIAQLNLKIIALRATDPIIVFSDYFTRPYEAFTKLQSRLELLKIADEKKQVSLPIIDFSGLPPVKFSSLMKLLDSFYKWVGERSQDTVRNLWNVYKQDILEQKNLKVPLQVCRVGKIFNYKENLNKWSVNDPWDIQPDERKMGQFDLIRNLFEDCFPRISQTQLQLLQSKDPLCVKFLSKPVPPFFVLNKLLFKKVADKYLLVIPKSLSHDLILFFHDYEKCWHLKKNKLYNYLKETFLVQGFGQSYQKVIDSCEFCLLNTPIRHKRPIPDGLTMIPNRPLEFWNLDYVVLNSSYLKYPSILTVTCVFSQYTVFIPCNDKQTDQQFLDIFQSHIIAHYGMPKAIGTDAQSSLVSTRVQVWAQLLHILKFESTAPQGNPSERQHKLLISVAKNFTRFLNVTESLIPAIAMFSTLLVNSLKCAPHQVSPNTLVWGFNRKHNFSRYVPLSELHKPLCPDEFFINYQKLQEIYLQIRKFLFKRNALKEKTLESYMSNIHISDIVLLEKKQFNTRVGHKLRTRFYRTPFRVIKKLKKSALISPLQKLVLSENTLKQRGKKLQLPKNLLVSLSRLKKIKNDLVPLGLMEFEGQFKALADVLNKSVPTAQIRLFQHDLLSVKNNTKIRDFYKMFNSKGVFDDRKMVFWIQNVVNFVKMNKGSLKGSEIVATEKSLFDVTCSYKMQSIAREQWEDHTFQQDTDLSCIYNFIKARKKPEQVFKLPYNPVFKKQTQSESFDSSVTVYGGEEALQDFNDYLHVSISSGQTASFHSNVSSTSNMSYNSTSSAHQPGSGLRPGVSHPGVDRPGDDSDISSLGDHGDDEGHGDYNDGDEIPTVETGSESEITIVEVARTESQDLLEDGSHNSQLGVTREDQLASVSAEPRRGHGHVTSRASHVGASSTPHQSTSRRSVLTVEFQDPQRLIQDSSLHSSTPNTNLPALLPDGTYQRTKYTSKLRSTSSKRK